MRSKDRNAVWYEWKKEHGPPAKLNENTVTASRIESSRTTRNNESNESRLPIRTVTMCTKNLNQRIYSSSSAT